MKNGHESRIITICFLLRSKFPRSSRYNFATVIGTYVLEVVSWKNLPKFRKLASCKMLAVAIVPSREINSAVTFFANNNGCLICHRSPPPCTLSAHYIQ